jgi:hypothetical protein
LIPMVLFADHALPVVAASYLLTGRFNPERTYEKYSAEGPDIEDFAAQQTAAPPDERVELVGTKQEWKQYQKALDSTVKASKDVIDKHDLSRFFKDLDRDGRATVDEDGSMWMDLSENGEPLRVGLSASNALSSGSNPQLAYKFFLARTERELKDPKHSRETMMEFNVDWAMLQRVSAETDTALVKTTASAGRSAAGYR